MDRQSRTTSQVLTLVAGIAVSTALGVFFYVKTDVATALATLAGLIGTVITLQVESIVHARHLHEEGQRQQLLARRVEAIAGMSELLDHSLSAYGSIEQTYAGTMVPRRLARKAFEDCLSTLRDLQRGHYRTPDSEESPNSPFYALTEQAQRSLLATTARSDIEWWLNTRLSHNYWRLNQEALARGVSITRIIMYQDWTDEIDFLAKKHHEAGVRVMRVVEDQLPPTLRQNLVVWDGASAWEPHYNAIGEWIESSFTFASQDVALMLDRLKMIESCAEPYPPKA
jgi:hypothetical protein